MINGRYSKAVVSLAGALTTFLSVYYSGDKWYPIASGVISTVLVLLVPNVKVVSNDTPNV